jgi:outer membrane protein
MTLALNWVVYDSGLRSGNIEVAAQTLSAATATQRDMLLRVIRETGDAYSGWWSADGVFAATLEAERAARRSLAYAKARQQVGHATLVDRLRAETALAQATFERVEAESALATSRATLAMQLAVHADELPDQPIMGKQRPRLPERTLGQWLDGARERGPAVHIAAAQLATAKARIHAAEASNSPTVAVSVAYVRNRQLGKSNGETFTMNAPNFGVQLNFPLFDGGARSYQRHAAQSQFEAGEHALDIARRQLELDVRKTYHEMISQAQRIQHGRALLASAELAERASELRYQAEMGTLLDLLNDRAALAAARKQLVQASAGWRVARLKLVTLAAQPLSWEKDEEP